MNDINALKLAAIRAAAAISDYDRGRIDVLEKRLAVEEYEKLVSEPANVLALVEALEARDKQIAELVAGRLNLQRTMGVYVHAYEEAKSHITKLESENEYIRNRYKELDLLIGKNILVMQAAIIEWQGTGDAKNGLAWIYNTLFGPGELPDEVEKDAQAYFDRKYAPLDEELMALHKWFWEQSEAERAAGIQVIEGEGQ